MSLYIVRWWNKENNKWIVSTYEPTTEEEARTQLDRDINYFYNDIRVQLVKIEEAVVEDTHGSQERRNA
jgi:hypothetical protein